MISYIYIKQAQKGIFVCPTLISLVNPATGEFYSDADFVIKESKLFTFKAGELNGYGAEIYIVGLNVPMSCARYGDFVEAMEKTESVLLEYMRSISQAN